MPETDLAVIDTNVVLDWLVFNEPSVQPLVEAIMTGKLRWIATAAMLAEQRHVVSGRVCSRWRADPDVIVNAHERWVCVVETPPAAARLRCTDPDDQMFIDLALAQRAPWLLTHDRALLKLARRARPYGTQILPPQRWTTIQAAT